MHYENVFFFDMFYMVPLYFPFSLLEICVSLKHLQVDCQAHALERTKLFLVLVYKTAGTVSQVISASSFFWSRSTNGWEGFAFHILICASAVQCSAILHSIATLISWEKNWTLYTWMGMKPARKHVPTASAANSLPILHLKNHATEGSKTCVKSRRCSCHSLLRDALCLYHFASNLQG